MIPIDFVLDREGVDYKIVVGSNGAQLNVWSCPFCGAEHWKVYINQEKEIGICFKCDTTFNKFSFTKQLLKTDNKGTFRYLDQFDKGYLKPQQITLKKSIVPLSFLPESDAIDSDIPYLQQRGISASTAKFFNLRYCHKGKYDYMRNDELISVDFSDTIVIPIYDLSGKLVNFQGRDTTGNRKSKYLFPAGLQGQARLLYNAHNAIGFRSIMINEGVFDVFAAYQHLQKQDKQVMPVATFGKHLSKNKVGEDQFSLLMKLKKYGLDEVYMCWDGSQDALQGAVNVMSTLNKVGLDTHLVRLPDGKDPNEVTSDTFLRCFNNAERYTPSLEVKSKLSQL